MKHASYLAFAFALTVWAVPSASAQASYKRDIPDSLAKQAKVAEEVAAKSALARVPKGRIEAVELERENGKLQYSYDIKIPGKSGIEEVNVNAVTGKIISVGHESPAAEKKEAAAEAKTGKPKKP